MKLNSILVMTFIIFLGGCSIAQPNTGYYWENYAGTLYNFKQSPDENSRKKHESELNKIITKAATKGSRVPPGIHAELGYMLAKSGNKSAAIQHLEMEIAIYPESKTFIERILLMLGLED